MTKTVMAMCNDGKSREIVVQSKFNAYGRLAYPVSIRDEVEWSKWVGTADVRNGRWFFASLRYPDQTTEEKLEDATND